MNSTFISIISKINDFLFRLEKGLCTTILVFIIGMTFVEIIMRYIFDTTLMVGVSEITNWCFVWLVAVGCAALVKKKGHISVAYFMDTFFSDNTKKLVFIIINLILALFFLLIIKSGLIFSIGQWYISATSANIPKTFVYIAIPVSMMLMFYHVIAQIILTVDSFKK